MCINKTSVEKEESYTLKCKAFGFFFNTLYKMCTRKALQTLSNSVADSIDYCREKLKLTQFQGSAPLTKIFRTLIFFFDILNSKSKFGKHWLPFLRTKSMSIEIFSEKQKSIFLS